MFTLQQANEAAAFANAHDGGVPQPRATVVPLGIDGRYAVQVDSLSVVFTGGGARRYEIESDLVHSRAALARVLGY